MAIIDSQIHVYEANTPKRPWHSVPNWPDHVTGDEMVAATAVELQRAHPRQFALVKPLDPNDSAVVDVIADWKKTPSAEDPPVIRFPQARTWSPPPHLASPR